MKLYGTFEGTHRATWSMEIEEHEWELFLETHPDWSEFSQSSIEEAWDYFKYELGCYDEPEESVDLHSTIVELEIV